MPSYAEGLKKFILFSKYFYGGIKKFVQSVGRDASRKEAVWKI
jgi:hypothetical protein